MERAQAQREYNAALEAVRLAENGASESAYDSAITALDSARRNLVEAEIAQPTKKESVKRSNFLRLANRGMDVFA